MQALAGASQGFADWLASEAGIADARIAQTIEGGNSNVTHLVESAAGPLVLRHPPADVISDRAAAGIEREFRFASAIFGKAPVAEPIAFCADASIIGAPFSVSRFVRGVSITEKLPDRYGRDVATIDRMGISLINALAAVHSIDPVPLGLGDATKAADFVPRQVARWRAVRKEAAIRELPLIEHLGEWLASNSPPPQAIRIVHCDYHLDNVLMDENKPEVCAILDWEMATLADPLVDIGLVTALWNRDEQDRLGFRFVQRVSNDRRAIGGLDLARHWSEAVGLSIGHLAYFQVFALWRLAAIVEGAFVIHREGQVNGEYERGLEYDVPALLTAAERIAERGIVT